MRPTLAAALAIGLIAGSVSLSTVATANPTNDNIVTEYSTTTSAEMDNFWTPERIRDAIPLDVPLQGPHAPPSASPAPHDEGEPVLVPGSTPIDGPSTAGISDTAGRLFFSMPDGTYVCSATVIAGHNKSMLATARHCGFGSGGTNYRFAPGYSNGNAPHGWWDWRSAGWVNGGDGITFDFAFVVLNTQNGRPVTDAVGSGGLAFNAGHGHYMRVVGIPASTNQFTSCEGWSYSGPANQYLMDNCNGLSGGASGGSWLINWNGNSGGYQVGTFFGSYGSAAAGSYFGDEAHGVWNSAQNT